MSRRTALNVVAVSVLVLLFLSADGDARAGAHTGSPSIAATLLSNSEFVYGPAARRFDLTNYLTGRGSPLLSDAGMIEGWCAYASVNPQVILALLELDAAQVTHGWQTSMSEEARRAWLGDRITGLAERFYRHLYEYGERAPAAQFSRVGPSVQLADGSRSAVSPDASSATFAVLDALAHSLTAERSAALADPAAPDGFLATWARLFPGSDPLDASISITPDAPPPADLLQFPFPVGQTWWFNGAHNWNGSGATYGKPYSSMDFFTSANSCAAPPSNDWAVAAAPGTAYHPSGYACWYRIDHTGGWSTSYYHLRNVAPNGQIAANSRVGTIACETCAGGFATGPHVHLSLLYNGAYVDLEGVKLSGWTIHSGSGNYTTGALERNSVQLKPYSSVLNEGIKPAATPTPTPVPTGTAKYLYPAAKGLVRTCPVTLVAEVSAPGAAQVRFLVEQGGVTSQAGADANPADGWQAQWDCEGAADGSATLSLSAVDAGGRELLADPARTSVTLSKACQAETYRTAFFANTVLSGAPTSSWCKASGVSYNWGTASPGAGVPGGDNFSARFRGDFQFAAGVYRFTGQADDGIRVWIDRALVVDQWHDFQVRQTTFDVTRPLSAGLHEVWLEYYERSGSAGVSLAWQPTNLVLHRFYIPLVRRQTK